MILNDFNRTLLIILLNSREDSTRAWCILFYYAGKFLHLICWEVIFLLIGGYSHQFLLISISPIFSIVILNFWFSKKLIKVEVWVNCFAIQKSIHKNNQQFLKFIEIHIKKIFRWLIEFEQYVRIRFAIAWNFPKLPHLF